MIDNIKNYFKKLSSTKTTREQMIPVCLVGLVLAIGIAAIGSGLIRGLINLVIGG